MASTNRFQRLRGRPACCALLLCAGISLAACASEPEAVKFCVLITVAPDLDLDRSKPSSVVIHLYPLRSQRAFDAPAGVILPSDKLTGATGMRSTFSAVPGKSSQIERYFPAGTNWVGIIAEFVENPQKLVTEARCGLKRDRLDVTAGEISIQ